MLREDPLSRFEDLVQILERRAEDHGERRAFVFVEERTVSHRIDTSNIDEIRVLTYGELARRARAIGAWLEREVGRGERALLLFPPGLDFASAFFGCLYAGVIAVPAPTPDPSRLERTLPRVRSILRDATPAVVLATAAAQPVRETVLATAPREIRWQDVEEVDLALAGKWRGREADEDELAYLQFTSGSTSDPKGVMASHGNLLHNCRALRDQKGYSPDCVAVMWVPNFHDDGLVQGTCLPVFAGHCCVLMSPLEVVRKPGNWLRTVSRVGATHTGGPNFIYGLAARKARPEACRELDLAGWRVAYNAAEPVLYETLRAFHRRFARHGFRWDTFHPSYGMAETTLLLSTKAQGGEPVLAEVDAAALEQGRVVECFDECDARTLVGSGRPISGTELRIVDPETRVLCPPDRVGEIWVSNPSVAAGYWQRPERTEEDFGARIATGTAAGRPQGEGAYLRTGDLGFVRDGEVFVTGRWKDMILVRGRNIYPQDLELAVEAAHPLLRPGCSAAFVGSAEECPVVVAEVDRRHRDSPGALPEAIRALRDAVAKQHELALFAVALIEPGSIPKTSSGKIQRRACRRAFLEGSLPVVESWRAEDGRETEGLPARETRPLSRAIRRPQGPERAERMLEYLQDLLAVVVRIPRSEIAPDFPLHRYGIDSLRDLEIANRLQEDLGVAVAAGTFLRSTTLRTQATELASKLVSGDRPAPCAPGRRIPEVAPDSAFFREGFPLSSAQGRLFFLDRLLPGNGVYNVPFFLRLVGPLETAVLAAALDELETRHGALRTVFAEREGGAVQRVRPPRKGAWPLPRVDLAGLGATAGVESRRLAAEEARRPFDLMSGPLFRATLVRLARGEHRLLLSLHHILCDGWSLDVLLRELAVLYASFSEGRREALPELPVTYADFAVWQRAQSREALAEDLAYWREELRDRPVTELPSDRLRPAVQRFKSACLPLRLPAELTEALIAVGRGEGATAAMTFLAGFSALLSRLTGQERVAVGSPVANRGARELEGLIGFFVNTLTLVAELRGSPGFRGLLARLRETALGAYAHQALPFEKLVEDLELERDLSRNPLFQVIFALHLTSRGSVPFQSVRAGEIMLVPEVLEHQPCRFDLELHLFQCSEDLSDKGLSNAGLMGFCSYDRDLFDDTTVRRMMSQLEVLLRGAAATPETPVAALPLLGFAERHQVTMEWDRADRRASFGEETLFEIFRVQAESAPDTVALVGDGETWSYGRLLVQARQLGRHLRSLGVGPETRVGLVVVRSPEAVAGILGILEAGGAYVPLDPDDPAQRSTFIQNDARTTVLLTRSGARGRLPEPTARVVDLGRLSEMGVTGPGSTAGPAQRELDGPRPENTAYVIYTSGSTGRPKGVEVTHRNATRLLRSTESWLGGGKRRGEPQRHDRREDVWTLFHSMAFDFSVWEIFGALGYGARLSVVSWEVSRSFDAFFDLVCRERISVLNQTPSAFEHLVRASEERPLPPALRAVIFGGEALDPRKLRTWRRRYGVDGGPWLVNMYGITETTVHVTRLSLCRSHLEAQRRAGSPIGRALPDLEILVARSFPEPVPVGVHGEIFVGGDGVARGYLGRPELTAERFVPDPAARPGRRMYRAGDLARRLADGSLEFLGRLDHQVKVRGHRIELGEVEAALGRCKGVRAACVVAREAPGGAGGRELVAYVVSDSVNEKRTEALRRELRSELPDYMVPARIVDLEGLPRLPNGKIDRKALPKPSAERRESSDPGASAPPRSWLERELAEIWCQVLGAPRVDVESNFFDLGGHSLALVEVRHRLRTVLTERGLEPPSMVELFHHPTVRSLASHLVPGLADAARPATRAASRSEDEPIAIVGMSGRFPGASNVEELWSNLADGVESISMFTDDELEGPASLRENPRFVRAGSVLEDIELFDAAFFDFAPREAELLDPQQRLFLECAWEALESAGHDPRRFPGRIGVFAGAGMNTYLLSNLWRSVERGATEPGPDLQLLVSSDKDFLATRVSYKLDLRGPSLSVQTACSTSLVAVALAADQLRGGRCEMALAGGVTIRVPQKTGYLYQPGRIASPDGRCRAFDARSRGTVGANGVGVVVLKRLADAVADRDPIHAVIRGFAWNNDGAMKVGYTAPGVEGQTRVISEALAAAGVHPETVGYVEAHGTGTELGDPIEVEALRRAFAEHTAKKRFCALGSVKTNLGHLDAAAGVAGLIKTVFALRHAQIPPSLHFEKPNPEIDFDQSPFFVNTELRAWPANGTPRRAGVSAFGVGGTNAHVVLEEPPARERPEGSSHAGGDHLLILSARTATALEAAAERLSEHLRRHQEEELADVAYTLALGRRAFEHRRAVVGHCREQLIAGLEAPWTSIEVGDPPVFFLFPGQGAQYPGMGRELYRTQPVFRRELDRCCELLAPELALDLRSVLYPEEESGGEEEALQRTELAQPALFAVEYALAQLWMSWGVRPRAMVGHSVGEYVAACLSGVFSLEDALTVVARRGRLMQGLAEGAMLAVRLPEEDALALLGEELDLAAANGPQASVLSGSRSAIDRMERELAARKVETRRLHTSGAFHSALTEPILERFGEDLRTVELRAPETPFVSNLSGRWITPAEAVDPDYWVRHLRYTVRFGAALVEICRPGSSSAAAGVLLEVGPGRSLGSLARRHPAVSAEITVLASLPSARVRDEASALLLKSLGRMWTGGVSVDWQAFYQDGGHRRLTLPTYPFERRRYWIEPAAENAFAEVAPATELVSTGGEIESPRAARPAPGEGTHPRPRLDTPYVAPESASELLLAGIWQEVLGISGIGARDDFFDLGGDSLLASQVLSRVLDVLGVELRLDQVFAAGTVTELARLVDLEIGPAHAGSRSGPTIPRAKEIFGGYPASFAQQRLWFLDQLRPESSFYNVPVRFELRGQLDRGRLTAALVAVVDRHETLRTTFTVVDGEPRQHVHASLRRSAPAETSSNWLLPVVDLAALEPAMGRLELRKRLETEDDRSFDLEAGLLFRALLFSTSPRDHLLYLNHHHVITDGWSIGILQRDLAAFYRTAEDGRTPSTADAGLPELAVRYVDFAAWQRNWLRGESLEGLLAGARESLGGTPPEAELPTDRPRPAEQRFRGDTLPFAFGPELSSALGHLGRRHSVTPAMLFLAAFFVLLGRLTGRTRVLVGSPVAGRNRRELEDLVGFFVNNVTFLGDLGGEAAGRRLSFGRLLNRVRKTALLAYGRQDLPFEKLVEELRPTPDLSRHPLFQVAFAFQNAPAADVDLPGVRLRHLLEGPRSTRLDLEMHLFETPALPASGFAGMLSFDRDLFDATTVRRLGLSYRTLLAAAAAPGGGEKTLDELPWLGVAQEHQLIAEWNDTSLHSDGRFIFELFEERAAAQPHSTVLVFHAAAPSLRSEEENPADIVWTYGELHRRADRLARDLEERGVGPEVAVGVEVEHRPELVLGFLGILKAGGVYVPLDPKSPRERRRHMMEDAAVSLVLGPAELAAVAGDAGGRPEPTLDGENLAYLIFTSGSTGRPKGAAIRHRGYVNFGRSFAHDIALSSTGERVLQFSSPSFDGSLVEITVALLCGAALHQAPREILMPGPDLVRSLKRWRVSMAVLTPSTVAALGPDAAAELDELRTLIVAGEACPPDLARRWSKGRSVLNGYGPTEGTVGATVSWLDGEEVLIGRPIHNVRVNVRDAFLRPLSPGVDGELSIGGVGVARGYYRRPALTAERFVPDPDTETEPGGRLYRTGDLVLALPDGRLDFLGRIDHQVKIRGLRIELGEIEAALAGLPEVREAVAVVAGAPPEVRLVAYITTSAAPSTAQMRDALRTRLPDYMVPSTFVFLEEFPRSPTGKLDRRALPAVGEDKSEVAYLAPRTPMEELVAAVWSELFKGRRERIGALDDFFELGGHSLLATRAIARMRETSGVELAVRELFEAPTVEALARKVESARRSAAPPMIRRDSEADPPLSFAQERLWFLDQMEPQSAFYNMTGALHMEGPLRYEALRKTFGELVRRHEVLRTTFATEGGRPVQVIAPPAPVLTDERPLGVVDLRGIDERHRGPLLDVLLRREAERPFDLVRGPLLHTVLFRLGEARHVLLQTMHHIVSDDVSMGILARDMAAIYGAEGAVILPKNEIRYADFAAWQRQWLRGEVLEAQLGYWAERLADLPALELAADRRRPSSRSSRGGAHWFVLPADLCSNLRRTSRRERTTLFMALLAVFDVLLHRYSGQRDFAVGTPVANRTHAGTENVVGFFVNTLVMRVALGGDLRFRELLLRVRDQALSAYTHQDVPFEHLVDRLGVERDLSRTPLFQVMLTLAETRADEFHLPGLALTPRSVETGTAKFDLTLAMAETGDTLTGRLEYSTDLFDTTTVRRMAEHFETLIRGATESAETRGGDLAMLRPSQSHQLLTEWTDTAPARWDRSTIHGQVEARAAAVPDRVALGSAVSVGVHLSYAQLLRYARDLARELRGLGVGPEVRVGMLASRSPASVVGILGILEAGGAYVPLDPDHPDERLAFLLEDGRVSVVVIEEHLLDRLLGTAWAKDRDLVARRPDSPRGGHTRRRLQRISPFALGCAAPSAIRLPGAEVAIPQRDPGIGVCPENVAYVIYTSGSTGRPKGVEITHGNVLRLFSATETRLGSRRNDVWTLFHSTAFDFSVWEIFGALFYGDRLVVVPWEVARSPEAFHELLVDERVTVLNQTPTAFEHLQRAAGDAGAPPTLRAVVFGGEALDPRGVRPWHPRCDGTGGEGLCFVNMYGITETTVHVTWHRVSASDVSGGEADSPIGRPLCDLAAYLSADFPRPAPLGLPAEIYVSGAGLARGYLGRPGLTAERFLPAPVSERSGARVYRTGDLARQLSDGRLEFLGRVDHQVKVRGYRIELGEVEAALARLAQVRAASVVADGGRLVAYLVLADELGGVESSGAIRELREALQSHLPGYMVPAIYVPLAELPRLPSGKIDRASLARRAPSDAERAPEESALTAPLTPVEEILLGIWSEVLYPGGDGRSISTGDDFFALGGHSLLATQVISRVRQSFAVELPVRALFEAPTVRELGRRVEEAVGIDPSEDMDRLEGLVSFGTPDRAAELGAPSDGVFQSPRVARPLSFAQQRLWLLDRMVPGGRAYNIPMPTKIEGRLDLVALRDALSEIVRRHEVLRTTFALRKDGGDGTPYQVIHPASRISLPVVDLGALAPARKEAEARRQVQREAGLPFDLEVGPLLRSTLLRLGEAEHVLLLTQHHIVSDAWSTEILRRELSAFYNRHLSAHEAAPKCTSAHRGAPFPLPKLTAQYADFAAWQRRWLSGERLEAQLGYWKAHLGTDPPVLELPTDHRRPEVQAFHGGARTARLRQEVASKLRALGRREGTTLMMTVLAGFFVLLSRTTGQRQVLVGSPIANRGRREVEDLIGFFVNTLALKGELGGRPSFRELLARVRETCLAAYSHQDLPFEKLVEELGLPRDLSRNPLIQVSFSLQMARPGSEAEMSGLVLRPLELDVRTTHFDLEMHLWEEATDRGPAGLGLACIFDRELFDGTTVDRWLHRFRHLLEQAAGSPATRVAELGWLSDPERHQVLTEWSASISVAGRGAPNISVLQAFAHRAAFAPHAVALVVTTSGSADRTWSYGALARGGRALGRRLRALGVVPEEVVGVLTSRTPEMILAYLAVLEAGGAYLPLDPGTPPERLGWMLRDAGARVLLTSASLADLLPPEIFESADDSPRRIVVPNRPEGLGGDPRLPERDGVSWAQAPAYIIYTSGSTGRPKGVTVSHAGLSNLVAWHLETYGVDTTDRASLLAAVSFDASVWEVWPYLAAGASLHVPLDEERLAPRRLLAWLAARRLTLCFLPTPLAQAVLEEDLPSANGSPGLGLRALLTGGDVLHRFDRSPPFNVVNHYGPTENSVVALCARVAMPFYSTANGNGDRNGRGKRNGGAPPIGRPIRGVRAYVLGGDLVPAPTGVPGELWLGGDSLARGYLRRPALTAERFVPAPDFGRELDDRDARHRGERLYRTGDRARLRGDGNLEFLGRLDHQVKIRGVRVEPGEIEAALLACAAVREAAVLARKVADETRLVGFVSPANAQGVVTDLPDTLRKELRRSLPEALVPADLVVLETFPRTASDKVDRRDLARRTEALLAGRPKKTFEPPGTEAERAVALAWREVLGVDEVGVHDNFFDVGGHSLAMVRIQERLSESLERKPNLVEMFQFPTIHQLARHLSGGAGTRPSRARAARQGEERHKGRARMASQLARRRTPPPRRTRS